MGFPEARSQSVRSSVGVLGSLLIVRMDWPPGRKAMPRTSSLGWRRMPLSDVSCRLQAARARPGRVLDVGIARGSHFHGVRQPEQTAVDLPVLAEGQSPVDGEVRRQALGRAGAARRPSGSCPRPAAAAVRSDLSRLGSWCR